MSSQGIGPSTTVASDDWCVENRMCTVGGDRPFLVYRIRSNTSGAMLYISCSRKDGRGNDWRPIWEHMEWRAGYGGP